MATMTDIAVIFTGYTVTGASAAALWQTFTFIDRKQESCAIAKMTAMRPTYGCPENFRDSLTTSTATIPIFYGLLFRSTL